MSVLQLPTVSEAVQRSIGRMAARMSISSLAPPDLYLLPGEVPETRDLEDARQWVSIYRELVTFSERTLNRLRKGSSDTDERVMETNLRRLQSRLELWERRLWDLAGLDLDVRRRVLTYAGQLVSLAWAAPELSPEQLRTYVVRLRRHLVTSGVPAQLVSEPRRGYGLVFTA